MRDPTAMDAKNQPWVTQEYLAKVGQHRTRSRWAGGTSPSVLALWGCSQLGIWRGFVSWDVLGAEGGGARAG